MMPISCFLTWNFYSIALTKSFLNLNGINPGKINVKLKQKNHWSKEF